MAPTPDEVLRPGIAASALMARYGQSLDRDSAHEILARKLQAGAEAAERGASGEGSRGSCRSEAKEQAKAQAQLSARRGRPRGRSRAARNAGRKSMVEQITGSSAFKQFARTAGTEIIRSIFGTARRRRDRSVRRPSKGALGGHPERAGAHPRGLKIQMESAPEDSIHRGLYLSCSRCAWHARHAQRQLPQRGIPTS